VAQEQVFTGDDGFQYRTISGTRPRFFLRTGGEFVVTAKSIVVVKSEDEGRIIGVTHEDPEPKIGMLRLEDVSAILMEE
jgi:hypothetical protein